MRCPAHSQPHPPPEVESSNLRKKRKKKTESEKMILWIHENLHYNTLACHKGLQVFQTGVREYSRMTIRFPSPYWVSFGETPLDLTDFREEDDERRSLLGCAYRGEDAFINGSFNSPLSDAFVENNNERARMEFWPANSNLSLGLHVQLSPRHPATAYIPWPISVSQRRRHCHQYIGLTALVKGDLWDPSLWTALGSSLL